jgi:hypothetical protein
MSRWIDAITDRTLTDILTRTAKAFINVSDWMRIYGNTEQVQAAIRLMLALEVPITELPEPVIAQFPDVADVNALIENIELLGQAACLPATIYSPLIKHDYVAGNGAVAPDYEDVNLWEQDLDTIRAMLARAVDQMVYCGVAGCGQERLWQARFRVWSGWVQPAASPVRSPRCGFVSCGSGLTRQNSWRKYS